MIDLPPVITSVKDLKTLCDALSRQPFVTVDTEFMRQTTYRPKLCLIQMAAPGIEAVVDPLPNLDLSPFYALMANTAVVKVFHAARQDIEIVWQEASVIPTPLFDTQIAAMALGHGEAISYGALVKKLLKKNHDKTYQAIDWCQRPLGPKQLEYALGDVTYLRDVYAKLKQRLEQTGREPWLEEEVAVLTDPKTYAFDPADAWKRLKLGGKSRTARAIIMELAAWRERAAQDENVPRGRVLKDEAIYEVAKHAPRTLETLSRLRSVRDSVRSRGDAILRAVEAALARDPGDVVNAAAHVDLSATASATVELLRVLLKAVSAELDIAPKLLASAEDLEKLAQYDEPDVPALKGWRRPLFGDKALALKEGRLALGIRKNEVAVFPL
ncbi:ribonuclease D [Rhodomicrobium lacus]|uniref:ribonuclease D n=1 Tax=Rhodomicrobium TaxID=1068 RepID=UPI0026E3F7E0|nr:ribonuclease D [Rhodomicrobium lacus]WKW51628.1 ribonuclease D [Rhodomicrobium lacus]